MQCAFISQEPSFWDILLLIYPFIKKKIRMTVPHWTRQVKKKLGLSIIHQLTRAMPMKGATNFIVIDHQTGKGQSPSLSAVISEIIRDKPYFSAAMAIRTPEIINPTLHTKSWSPKISRLIAEGIPKTKDAATIQKTAVERCTPKSIKFRTAILTLKLKMRNLQSLNPEKTKWRGASQVPS